MPSALCEVSASPCAEYGSDLSTSAAACSSTDTCPGSTVLPPTLTFRCTCGVRAPYQPGKVARRSATPSPPAFWWPRRYRVSGAASPKPEYTPSASQCQISTSAPAIGSHERASWTVNAATSGSPALPSRMSRRLSASSIQYGPSVVSGLSTHVAPPSAVVVAPSAVVVALGASDEPPHAAISPLSPSPPRAPSRSEEHTSE